MQACNIDAHDVLGNDGVLVIIQCSDTGIQRRDLSIQLGDPLVEDADAVLEEFDLRTMLRLAEKPTSWGDEHGRDDERGPLRFDVVYPLGELAHGVTSLALAASIRLSSRSFARCWPGQ